MTFTGWKNQPLAFRHWSAQGERHGVVVMVHGIGGHSGLFEPVASTLTRQGYALYALDLPGHGHSPGPRGWIPRWDAFRLSLARFLDQVEAEVGCTPTFLLGHSLGGTVVLDLLLSDPSRRQGVRGVIVSNPALDPGGIEPWRRWLALVLSRLWPRFCLSTGIRLDATCRDPDVLAGFAADTLRHGRCTARLGTEFMGAAAAIRREAPRLETPLLVLQSGRDSITLPEGAHRFFAAVGATDKTWKFYPDSYHEIYDDLDQAEVLRDVADWLTAHGT